MIDIIKHGYKYRTAICQICKCEFSFQKEDLQTITLFSYPPQIEYCILCPECGQMIYLTKEGFNE